MEIDILEPHRTADCTWV